MITTQEARELEELSFTIHTQILRDYHSTPDQAHLTALRALHHLLANMVNGEDTSLHGRWPFSLPIGMGKTSGIVAFIVAAYQLGLLTAIKSRISMTITAARIDQLHAFEEDLLDNGIPQADIRSLVSVIHDNHEKSKRESDQDKSVPILIIAHNRIRAVYRRNEGHCEHDLNYFLKYGTQQRDIVIWDEACQLSESVSLLLRDVQQGIDTLASFGEPMLQAWLREKLAKLEDTRASLTPSAEMLVQEGEGLVLFSDQEQAEASEYYRLVTGGLPGLLKSSRDILIQFLELFRFFMRVIPSQQPGVASFRTILPSSMHNFLSLDAGFVHNRLAKEDERLRDPEKELPMLQTLSTRFGVTLSTLKDCSSQTIFHWNHGAGKDVVARDLEAYNSHSAKNGNLIVEVLAQIHVKQEQGQKVLVWIHKRHFHRDLASLFRKACRSAGLNVSKTHLTIQTYGQHDSRNDLKGYPVHFHLGVQERSVPDLSGEILGYRNKNYIALPKTYLTEAKLTDKALTFMQSTGRGPCRDIVEGKAGQQESWVIYSEDSVQSLTTIIKGCFPGCQWKAWPLKTVSRLDEAGLMQTVQDSIERHLDGLPLDVEQISSRKLKAELKAEKVAASTWTSCIKAVGEVFTQRHKSTLMKECEYSSPWQLVERSFLRGRVLDRALQKQAEVYGFKGEIAQTAA